jgi:hypothetical protein
MLSANCNDHKDRTDMTDKTSLMRSQFLAALKRCTDTPKTRDKVTLPTGTVKTDEVRKVLRGLHRCSNNNGAEE